jgi:hypothetical protein
VQECRQKHEHHAPCIARKIWWPLRRLFAPRRVGLSLLGGVKSDLLEGFERFLAQNSQFLHQVRDKRSPCGQLLIRLARALRNATDPRSQRGFRPRSTVLVPYEGTSVDEQISSPHCWSHVDGGFIAASFALPLGWWSCFIGVRFSPAVEHVAALASTWHTGPNARHVSPACSRTSPIT